MKAVTESAEHHLLTILDALKAEPECWVCLHFSFSKNLIHHDLVQDLEKIQDRLKARRVKAERLFDILMEKTAHIAEGFVYIFSDHDVLLLAKTEKDEEYELIKSLHAELALGFPPEFSTLGVLMTELYSYQKLLDQKILSAKRMDAYRILADSQKVSSIAVRRSRRDYAQVMIVEDDRFTASYAAGSLSKEYDLVLARTGEEAIIDYIENAPDVVFLDIHLPGLSGHDTLEAIRAADPKAFVVMLSVDTVKESIVRASEGGARNFIKKPFTKEKLVSVVKSSPYVRGLKSNEGSRYQ